MRRDASATRKGAVPAMTIEDRIKELLEEETIKRIRITREAFEKMNLYARFVSDISGIDLECGGVLLNYRNKQDDIIRDVHLSDNQEVETAEGKLKIGECYAAARDQGKKICGMWHSHGGIPAFHSEWDDSQLRVMYASNRESKIITGTRSCALEVNRENENLKIKAGDKMITIKTKDKLGEISAEQLIEKKFLNSIVINRDSYTEHSNWQHGYYGECWTSGKKEGEIKKLKRLELELIEEENGIIKDKLTLAKECGEKVIYEGIRLKEYPNYERTLREHEPFEKRIDYKHRLRKFYENYPAEDKIDHLIVNIAKTLAGDYKRSKKSKIKSICRNATTYAIIGALAASIVICSNIEKISLSYLNKTRPDVVSMMREGRPFSEVAKQYFKNEQNAK